MNLLLDTNVVIDYLGRKPPFFEDACKVVAAGYFGDARLWVAVQSLKDAFYVLERYVDSLKIQQAIVKLCEVVRPIGLTGEEAVRAARLQWPDYEDCLIALAAQKADADYLVTRDAKGFDRSLVPVISPKDWLALMGRDSGLKYGEGEF